jgi:hypothetical protein
MISLRHRLSPLLLIPFSVFVFAAVVDAQSSLSEPLFRIERSKNANVVQYDARVQADGDLDRQDPVDAYWLRLASDGDRKELTWIQKTGAYGFSTRWIDGGATLELDIAADIERTIEVVRDDGAWRARCRIDGRPAWIERIFVQSEKALIGSKVVHIDFAGIDVETGERLTERLVAK